jgi:hypothetical protein
MAPPCSGFTISCDAYGADQETFGDLADHQHLSETRALFQGHLPEGRARGCRIEFGELNFAFQHLIKPHMDQELAKAVLQDGWLPDVLAEPDAPPEPPKIKE